jgi:hypothetical protein
MRYPTFFVIFFYVATLGMAFGETEDTLEKAEALMTELKFYEAVVALEPLLVSNEKSKEQEKVFWLANVLCERLAEIFMEEYRESSGDIKVEKLKVLNRLGADIEWNYFVGYVYGYGFLKRLLELYPNSSWAPIAEYYLIKEGYPVAALDHDKTLNALHAYVMKYAKNGLAEVYMAYLDIANINHGIWAALTYPDEPGPGGNMGDGFISGDPKKDKKRAAACKAEALKYYAKFIANGHGLEERKDALEWYEKLKQNEKSGFGFIIFGC